MWTTSISLEPLIEPYVENGEETLHRNLASSFPEGLNMLLALRVIMGNPLICMENGIIETYGGISELHKC